MLSTVWGIGIVILNKTEVITGLVEFINFQKKIYTD